MVVGGDRRVRVIAWRTRAAWVAAALVVSMVWGAALRPAAASALVVDDRDHGDAACALDERSGAPAGRYDARTRVCTLARDVDLAGDLRLAADRLTLDCDGHRLRGAGGGNHVDIVARAHVTVRDCVLEDVAVRVVASRDVVLSGNRIAGAFEAISVHGTTLLRVADNELTGGGGIGLTLVHKALLRDNLVAGAFTGLTATGVTRALITRNHVVDAAGVAVALAYARDNTLDGNVIERCGSRGLELVHASDNLLARNLVSGCGAGVYARRSPAGIALSGGRGNRVVQNRISGNQLGVLFGGDHTIWSGNRVEGSPGGAVAFDPEVGCDHRLDGDSLGEVRLLIVTRDHQLVRGGRHAGVLVCGARGVMVSGVDAGALLLRRAPLAVVRASRVGQLALSASDFALVAGNRLGGRGPGASPVVNAGDSRFVTFVRNQPEARISGCRDCVVAETAARAAPPDAHLAAR
jgi:parallel beta-helix repeat protein